MIINVVDKINSRSKMMPKYKTVDISVKKSNTPETKAKKTGNKKSIMIETIEFSLADFKSEMTELIFNEIKTNSPIKKSMIPETGSISSVATKIIEVAR